MLITLRETEDKAAESPCIDLFENDEYLAYDEALTRLVQAIAESSNEPRAWKSLVYMRYNADSPYGKWFADHRNQTLPFLSQQLNSPSLVRRATSVYVVALCLKKMLPSSAQYRSLKSRVRFMAGHDKPPVDQYAMQGLALLNDRYDVPFLSRLSRTAANKYSRAAALEAARSIQTKF